jgi:methionyl aminopeptidase
MIIVKNSEQIALMKKAGVITAEALLTARELIKPGISTKEIDTKIRRFIEKCGATPSFLGYSGFPASACISVNNKVTHGIPADKVILNEGDIV